VSQPEPIPKWRLVLYACLAAGGVAGIGVVLHEPFLFVAAVFAGALVGGLGLLLNKASASRNGMGLPRWFMIISLLIVIVRILLLLHKR
jgi:hypothetical protein